MPKYEITSPDGRKFEVNAPDGATQDQVMAYAQQQFAQPPKQAVRDAQAQKDVAEVPKRLGSMALGVAKGAADLVQAPAQLIMNGANSLNKSIPGYNKNGAGSKFLSDKTNQFNEHLKNQEDWYQQETPGSGAAGIGRVAAQAAPFILSGGGSQAPQALDKTAKAVNALKIPAQGAGIGMMQPVNNVQTTANPDGATSNDFMRQKGMQAALGAGASVVGAGLGNAAGRIIRPNTAPEVRGLLDQGVTPTAGQILGGKWKAAEDKLTSVPILGDAIKNAQRHSMDDVNRAAYQRVLDPLGKDASKLPIGREGVAELKTTIKNAYDDLLPKLQFKADQQFSSEVSNLQSMIGNGNIPPEVTKQFNNILKNDVFSRMSKTGGMDGQNFKAVEEALGKKIKNYSSGDANQRELGSALSEVLSSARAALTRSNPAYAKDLSAVNEAFANYARVRTAAAGSGAESGVFTPAQLASAVRASDKSAGKGKYAAGQALMQDLSDSAKSVVGGKYPDSGTAGRTAMMMSPGVGAAMWAAPIPTTIGLGVGGLSMLPYTGIGQKMTAGLLAKRPESAAAAASLVRQASPAFGAAMTPSLLQMFQGGSN